MTPDEQLRLAMLAWLAATAPGGTWSDEAAASVGLPPLSFDDALAAVVGVFGERFEED